MASYTVIGRPVPRPDGFDKVSGRARYAADFDPPGTLWGRVLHSPHAHARIKRIHTAAARRLPGVHAVITAADIDPGPWGRAIKDIPVLARDRVRFAGERVAAVAAADEDVAEAAVDLIEVEYEALPAVLDCEAALADTAPLLHPDFAGYVGGAPQERPSNAYNTAVNEWGDIEAGFAAAQVIVENTYRTPRVHHAYLETQSVLVQLQGDEVLVWTCSKAPYDTRAALAGAVRLPAESIVFHHCYIGGDFGGKATPANLPIAYYLARATGRPVRMVNDYVEEFSAANPRHATVIHLRTGLRRDGTIVAHHGRALINTGAYAGYKPLGIIGGAVRAAMAGPYRIANARLESAEVYTNTVPCGHMRSPGEPQAVFALESHMDEIARRLGMDPVQFRLRNLAGPGEETATHGGRGEVRGRETLLAAVEAAAYGLPKGSNVGRGVAIAHRAPAGGEGTVTVTLRADGTAVVGTAIFDQGTGTYATLRQVVAEELGLSPESVTLEVWPTGAVGFDSGVGGMRATRVNTAAAHAAATDAKRALLALAAERLGWPQERLVLRGGEVRRTDTEEAIPWPELLQRAGGTLTGRGHIADRTRSDVASFAVQVAEVEVDPETGRVSLLKLTTAHDVGQIVNPIGHQGQINGGLVQGIGYALMEELRLEEGRVQTLSFGDYKVPTARDLPQLRTVILPSEDGIGPYGIQGIGETPNTPTAAAIANAVADAVGVRVRDLPITAEKVYRALRGG